MRWGWRELLMRQVRTNRRWSTWLALAAITLQLVLSFGHTHLEKLASGSSGPVWRRPRRPRPISIPQTRRTIFARSARRSISPRRRSCRMRRLCQCLLHPERSSISVISLSFLSRRNVRHFNRALRRSPDSWSLLIWRFARARAMASRLKTALQYFPICRDSATRD